MKKLTLDVAALQVQSFATDDARLLSLGTVHGRQGQGNTGLQDTDCSAVDACASARGCSEIDVCRPTEGNNCPSAALACPTSRGCTQGPECNLTRNPQQCESAVDACPSARGCTEIDCNPAAS